MIFKLMRYDFNTMFAKIIPLYITLIFSVIIAIILNQLPHNLFTYIADYIIEFLIIISFLITILFSLNIGVYRYYTNVLREQGYLTNTLPVKKGDIIISIIICSALIMLITLSLILILFYLTSLYNSSLLNINFFNFDFTIASQILILQTAIFFIVLTIANNLFFIFSLTVGHSFNTRKVINSLFVGVVLYIITLAFFLGILILLPGSYTVDGHFLQTQSLNLINALLILFNGIIFLYDIALFLLTSFFLRKRLNLS